MKRVLIILSGSLVCLSFVSAYTEKELLGTWQNTEYDIEKGVFGYSITFKADSTFKSITLLDSSYDQASIIYDGIYLIQRDSLFLTFQHPWGKEAFLITELTDNSLRFSGVIDNQEVSYQLTKKN